MKPASALRIRYGARIREKGVQSRGGLQARWSTNRQLRTRWKGLSKTGQTAWHAQQQSAESGRKRTADELVRGDYSKDAACDDKMDDDDDDDDDGDEALQMMVVKSYDD